MRYPLPDPFVKTLQFLSVSALWKSSSPQLRALEVTISSGVSSMELRELKHPPQSPATIAIMLVAILHTWLFSSALMIVD